MYLASFVADIKCVKVHSDYLLCTKIPEKIIFYSGAGGQG